MKKACKEHEIPTKFRQRNLVEIGKFGEKAGNLKDRFARIYKMLLNTLKRYFV
jgi:hypothetical protein